MFMFRNSSASKKQQPSPSSFAKGDNDSSSRNSSGSRMGSNNSSGGSRMPNQPRQAAFMKKSVVPPSVRGEISAALENRNFNAVTRLLRENPQSASVGIPPQKGSAEEETLIAMSVLRRAPLEVLETVHKANVYAITQDNSFGLSVLHHASTVATDFRNMAFLLDEMKKHKKKPSKLVTPDGWYPIHMACRMGALPVHSFHLLVDTSLSVLSKTTSKTNSTPLHYALHGFSHRQENQQREMLFRLIQECPYAINIQNHEGKTPIAIAQTRMDHGLSRDVLELMKEVKKLIKIKYSTRVSVEQAIKRCDAVEQGIALPGSDSFSSSSGNGTLGPSQATNDMKADLRRKTLAHIEKGLLAPLRDVLPSEDELRVSIEKKALRKAQLERKRMYAQTTSLVEEIAELQARLQMETDAKTPQDVNQTRDALWDRVRTETHMFPFNKVALKYLEECTDNFSEGNKIGKGGFGCVFRAYDAKKCSQYAVKKAEKVDDKSLQTEVDVLSSVFHPNIIKLLGFYVPPGCNTPEFIVYEYASGGSLADRLSCQENRETLTWSIRLSAAVGVASGLNYLHNGLDQKILHHDLKPDNIVFNETLDRAILIDFGIGKIAKERHTLNFTKTMAGTTFYLPDDYCESTPYTEATEMFSFGMVLKIMISGRLPKCHNDRTAPLVVDPLAGQWPESLIGDLISQTNNCLSPKDSMRPTVSQMHGKLVELQEQAEAANSLTEEQALTITADLNQSRLVSRRSRKLGDFGKCACSKHKKKGLYCPAKQHFQCSECFNKRALDYLGEDLYCPVADCASSEPFTLDELHEHLRGRVMCAHVEMRMKNREISVYKRMNDNIVEKMEKNFDRVMAGVTALARDELKCPMLALLIPANSGIKKAAQQRAMSSWKSFTKKTFFLYFLCAHDNSLVEAPIRISTTREWVKTAAPFLRAALIGIQVAITTIGVPVNLPMIGKVEANDDRIKDLFSGLEQMYEGLLGLDDDEKAKADSDMKDVMQAMKRSRGHALTPRSYAMVSELANQPDNVGWKDHMVLAERMGEIAWIRKENVREWQQTIDPDV